MPSARFLRLFANRCPKSPHTAHLDAAAISGLPGGLRIRPGNLGGKGFAIGPHRAVFEVLLLPYGNSFFEGIDEPAAGVKCRPAMRRGHCNQHAGLADLEPSEPMDDGDIANWELLQGSCCQRCHLLQRHVLVSLIVEIESPASARLIPDDALKHESSAVLPELERVDDLPC